MLAIDSSTIKTGIAIFNNGDYQESLLLDCSNFKNMEDRFKEMSLKLIHILDTYKPYIIYIEETVVNRNVAVQRFLTRLQGVIYGYCVLNDCEFNAIRPTSWRKLAGINQKGKKRNELKKLAIDAVYQRLGFNVGDDEAEAILIGIAALELYKLRTLV
ncbi:hypothetical protein [uncultured Robinsoniella sp.]|uniref:hypothetical protein n=1 Tax=Robinsoniella sp. TaxID=2496533 RepID=UPI00374EC277